jgi:hypothetical protein
VIWCVVPPELEADLHDRLVAYYADNPAVTVVVDRRSGRERRSGAAAEEHAEKRKPGDRRRHGGGGFVSTDVRDP